MNLGLQILLDAVRTVVAAIWRKRAFALVAFLANWACQRLSPTGWAEAVLNDAFHLVEHEASRLGWSLLAAQSQPMQWPNHKKATIVLTYDDALVSQLDSAVPQLKKAGFKATFFLTSDIDFVTMPRWRPTRRSGTARTRAG